VISYPKLLHYILSWSDSDGLSEACVKNSGPGYNIAAKATVLITSIPGLANQSSILQWPKFRRRIDFDHISKIAESK
jgi:hypothetical protein